MGLTAKPHSDLVPISLIVILPSTATHTIRSLLLLVRGGSAVVASQFEIHGERRVGAGCGGGSPHGKGKGASAMDYGEECGEGLFRNYYSVSGTFV